MKKLSLPIAVLVAGLLLSLPSSAHERNWSVQKAPMTWDLGLFEDDASPTQTNEIDLNGILQTVPVIVWRSNEEINQEWASLKSISDPQEQLASIRRSHILASVCDGLVDFRALTKDRDLPLRWRDQHRGRTWLEPTTASTLLYALDLFKGAQPGYMLTLGDMTQTGCGQLEYGTLIEHVQDSDLEQSASQLINKARLYGGEVSVRTIHAQGGARTLIEKNLIGRSFSAEGDLLIRVATRRYKRQGVGPTSRARKRVQGWDRAIESRVQLETTRVTTTLENGRSQRLWRQHWVSPSTEKQIIIFSRRRLDPTLPIADQLSTVVEMRFSRWNLKKPLSFKSEQRWVSRKGQHSTRWEAWSMAHEAGHQTHTSGRDVDISYVTKANQRHFNGSWKTLDAKRTWEWFQLLAQAARDADGRVEKILVGPRTYRLLRRRLSKKVRHSAFFRKTLKVVEGHDAHHHLRIAPTEGLGLAIAPWIWRIDEPFFDLMATKFSELLHVREDGSP